ncbi:MAG: VOC family protein, partial [Pseudomonadota bacterium]
VLGMTAEAFGAFILPYTKATDQHGAAAVSVFAPFAGDTDYFEPSELPFMINLMVDDLDEMLSRVEAEGVAQVQPREDSDLGAFAWIMDPDGRKIELWQPPSRLP